MKNNPHNHTEPIDIEIVERMLDRCASQDPHYLADFIERAFEDDRIDAVWAGLQDGSFELSDEHTMAFYLVRC